MPFFVFKKFRFDKTFLRNDSINNLKNTDVLFFCHDNDKGDEKFGKIYSKLIDSIHEEFIDFNIKCLHVALPYTKFLKNKCWAEPFNANRQFFFSFLVDFLINKITIFLHYRFKYRNYFTENVYLRIYRKSSPKIIFVIGANISMCNAARKLNIPVVEILHGIGYEKVPWGWNELNSTDLPNYVLSLDRISTSTFKILEKKGLKVIEIPHPWYKRFTNNQPNSNLDSNWVIPKVKLPKRRKVILLSLVWGYDGDDGIYSQFSNILSNGLIYEEVLKCIEKTKNDVFWCIRRHPVHLRNDTYQHQIKFLNRIVNSNENVDWFGSTNSTLVSLLPFCDGHISMSSMTSYDSALFGVCSLLLCPTLQPGNFNEGLFEDLVSTGHLVKSIPDVDFILNWVTKVKKIKPFLFSDSNENDWLSFLKDLKLIN